MALAATKVKQAKPREKAYKIYDERGLFLIVKPNGSKLWRFKYRFAGKYREISMGVYPDVSLAKARKRRDLAREQLADGLDPSMVRQANQSATNKETFEAVAREWWGRFSPKWSKNHASRIMRRLEKDIFPWMGNRPIRELEPPELLQVIRRIEARGAVETAHRALQNCGQIFRYGVATGRCARDPSPDLRGAITPVQKTHFASIKEPAAIGELMRAIHGYTGEFVTRCALQLAALTFVRPGELRYAEWSEFDLDAAQWRIPGSKMKMGRDHIVPLSRQAVDVLRDLEPLTGQGRYVFPSIRSKQRPMSENTVNGALRRLGYTREEMTGHGFRSMASTILNEQQWPPDVIERQLAHGEKNQVRAAYNHAEHLPERKRMMQHWADYLDGLRKGGDVVPIGKVGDAVS